MCCGIIPVAWDHADDYAALRIELVIKARATEMQYFKNMGVHEFVLRSEIKKSGGKRIDTRWIDTNKANELNPEYRPRHGGRADNTRKDDSLDASTPPCESLRFIVSWAATVKKNAIGQAHALIINDVRRAYFYA